MKQDIRELFKNNELEKKKLPSFHEKDFLEKLERFNKNKLPKKHVEKWKIAVSILLIFSIGYYFFKSEIYISPEPTLFVQVKKIEKEYLSQIDNEWESFIKLTSDKELVKRYEEKLSNLDINYKEISNELKQDPNNIMVLEKLIENLQTRLKILKDIQNHIKELNQKNISNETITI